MRILGGENAHTWPERCFRTPSVGQSLGIDGSSVVVLLLVLGAVLFCSLGVAIVLAAQGRDLYLAFAILGGLFLVPLSCFGVWFGLLTFRKGRIVLQEQRLVEYGYLNHSRTFSYDQIYAVRRGRYVNQTVIRYYTCRENGQIDYGKIRQVKLVSVHRYDEMRAELGRRIAAPEPEPHIEHGFLVQAILWPLIVFGLLLVVGLAVLIVIAR